MDLLLSDERWFVHRGDSARVLGMFGDSCFDAMVTDPPGGIGIGGKEWDSDMGGSEKWISTHVPIFEECLRVVKPGGGAFVWALPRTSHWTAFALERAGWRIEDIVTHIQAQGWPKRERLLRPASEHWILVRRSSGQLRSSIRARFRDGRWPPNAVFSHERNCSERACAEACAVAELIRTAGIRKSGSRRAGVRKGLGYMGGAKGDGGPAIVGSTGTADRFFPVFRYESKAKGSQRDVFLPEGVENENPAAKSIPLIVWLISLLTEQGDVVLDPFAGWGSIPLAALLSGRRVVAIEKDQKSADAIRTRMTNAKPLARRIDVDPSPH